MFLCKENDTLWHVMKLKGKVALVAGGSGGIGRVVCMTLAREGATVAIFSKDKKAIEDLKKNIERSGGKAVGFVGEIARPDVAKKVVGAVIKKFKRIDILVNMAAIQKPIGLFGTDDMKTWKRNIEVTLLGTVNFAHAVLPHMLKQKSGTIVNFGGGGASGPRPHFTSYAVGKTGIIRFTETLAAELKGTGVRVNAVAPGTIHTPLLEEIVHAGVKAGAEEYRRAKELVEKGTTSAQVPADLVLFLASNDSHTLSGKLIAAIWDGWRTWSKKDIEKIQASDACTLRRVNP